MTRARALEVQNWTLWDGKTPPVFNDEETLVEVEFRDGRRDVEMACNWSWRKHDGEDDDIMSWRVVEDEDENAVTA